MLVALSLLIDGSGVAEQLGNASTPWLVAGLAISVPQALLLAWRWRYTAGRLGIDLPFRSALAEYYLGNFMNQVLPGGVTGDVARAWRHARTDVAAGAAVRAVVLERLSAQAVMTSVAALSVVAIPGLPVAARVGAPAALVLLGAVATRVGRHPADPPSGVGRLRTDAYLALLSRDALLPQMVSAMLVVGSYLVVFAVAARAVGAAAPLPVFLPLIAPILMTMLLPVTVAGWGLREGAAAALWGVAGLTPESGVAVSVTYGLISLMSTLPGAAVLIVSVARSPDRGGRRPQAENGASSGEERPPETGSAAE
jgi:uncharacterized membrane protein YbhN (UPF0104 family)